MKRIGFLLSTALYAVAAATLPAHADAFLDEAKALVAKATAPASAWDGPTAGPAIAKGKSIIYIASDMKNGGVMGVEEGVAEAAKIAGWKLDVLDGAGSVKDQLAALNQAIAKKGVRFGNGSEVSAAVAAGLITRDRRTIYRVEDDIPVMLADEAIATDQLGDFPDR